MNLHDVLIYYRIHRLGNAEKVSIFVFGLYRDEYKDVCNRDNVCLFRRTLD